MKKIKDSRALSFLTVIIIYILAAAVGITVYRSLRLDWRLSLLIADTAATVFTFIFSVIFKNASVYDPYWSVQPIVIVLAFAAVSPVNPLRILLVSVICLWGIRLTANWAYTFKGLNHQDWRYTMLKEKTGKFYPVINFVGIHFVPTVIVYGCVLPACHAFVYDCDINTVSLILAIVPLGAVTLQGTADIQMHRFRKNRNSTFIRTGLWKHSRHPNYLGEITMWWGVALMVVCSYPESSYLIAGAVANTVLFLCVSIPMADGRQSQRPGFEEYKKQTRMLFPIKKIKRG